MRGMTTGFAVLAAGVLAAGTARSADLALTSPDFNEGGTIKVEQVFKGFGCTGGNLSPTLSWSGAPAGTKSFALTVYDPDAPTGSGWWHWVIFDIPPQATQLPKGAGNPKSAAAPKGSVQTRTDFDAVGYGGPCPPPGKPHRYIFTLFALDLDHLPVKKSAPPAMVGFNLNAHTLAKATLTGLYGR
jgi:Raf kinase inhibitor-like YbhB/YbcL family protein